MNFPTNQWGQLLASQLTMPYFQALQHFIISEYSQHRIYPSQEVIFNALALTDFEQVKVVILGQDPYHGDNQAHGLAFSVPNDVALPPSLRNIFKELESDLNIDTTQYSGNLEGWAKQGVLLLNTVLTVRAGEAFSHKQKGWETFTDHIISILSQRENPIVFVLWGKPAQLKRKLIAEHHIIIEGVHPSPLSAYRGFFGSNPFSTVNDHLQRLESEPIDWSKLMSKAKSESELTLF